LARDRSHPPRPRIYLAGPEVFLPDALAIGRAKQELCARAGFEGVFPLDNVLDLARLPKRQQAQRISAANEALLRTCSALIANLTPFRGVSMDAGTAFEVGFMRALGRPVLGYSNVVADYRRRAEAYRRANVPLAGADAADVAVEDYDLAENLMIEAAIQASGGEVIRRGVPPGREMRDLAAFEACLVQAQRVVLA
jgi:nucleoside 2-deoxyribosyltransferase